MTQPFAPPRDAPPELQALDRSLATVVLNPQGRILRANERFLALFGYGMAELVGQDAAILVPPDEREASRRQRPKGRIDESWTTLGRRQRRDGSELWVRSHVTPVAGPDGALMETVVILSDVTADRDRAERDRGMLAALDLSHAVLCLAPDGTILEANEVFLRILGYRLEDIVGQNYRMVCVPARSWIEDPSAFWNVLREGRHCTDEFRYTGKDGRTVWMQATHTPIMSPSGALQKVVQYGSDITEGKGTRFEREWQIAAIDKSLAVVTFDMSGAIIRANANFLEAFGYDQDEIEGRHHRILVDPAAVHGADYAAFWRQLRSGRHHSGQYKRIRRDGRPVWLQATYNPVFDLDGRPVQVVKYATIITEERLRQAENESQVAALHKSHCVVSFALDGTILDANDNFLQVIGYRYAELLGRNHRMLAGIGDDPLENEAYRSFWRRLAKGHHQAGEYRQIGKDGREVWLQATYSPILDMDGRPFKIVKYAIDITAAKLRQADQQGQLQAIGKSQGVMTLGLCGTILDANANLLAALGYGLDEIRGHPYARLLEVGATYGEALDEFWTALRSGHFRSGLRCHVGRDKRRVWLQASYNPILDLAGNPFKIVVFAANVTENVALAEAYEDAKRQARLDPATSLPNRMRLSAFMTPLMSQPMARMAVIYLDLDRFKPINDTFGHDLGDFVLGEAADRMRRHLGNDQLVARVGGDEFVIAAPDLDAEGAERLCRRLTEDLARPMQFGGNTVTVGVSVGVALAPADATTVDDLLRCADAALFRSKREGGGVTHFYAVEENERLSAMRRLSIEMRHGIDNGEFVVEYQPRFETVSRRMRSVEALVRWAHPERGRISPADFIPLAERSGLIIPLGETVLRTACRTVAAMGDIGVSVNVSPVQFRDPRLVEIIASALTEAGLPADRLELEITEGTLIEDAEGARAILGRLKDLGVRLAMDDFGTGYSSMSYLCDFPFDVIKIDRKFVLGLEQAGRGLAVVQAMVGLGRSLGLGVTAEGVETAEQLLMLTQLQCHEVQGFLLARPMSEKALARLRQEEASRHIAEPATHSIASLALL